MTDQGRRYQTCRHCGSAIQQVTSGAPYTYWSHVGAGPSCGGKWKAGSLLAEPAQPTDDASGQTS